MYEHAHAWWSLQLHALCALHTAASRRPALASCAFDRITGRNLDQTKTSAVIPIHGSTGVAPSYKIRSLRHCYGSVTTRATTVRARKCAPFKHGACPAQPHRQVRRTEGTQKDTQARHVGDGPVPWHNTAAKDVKVGQSHAKLLRGVRHEAEAHPKVLRELRPPQRHCRARSERPVLQGQRPLCAGLHRGDVME
jgi:hypothetical protein